tara:strand:- start:800 stop:1084 length:285 start_codon:yes stop_codon:yes gene_type:complete
LQDIDETIVRIFLSSEIELRFSEYLQNFKVIYNLPVRFKVSLGDPLFMSPKIDPSADQHFCRGFGIVLPIDIFHSTPISRRRSSPTSPRTVPIV